MSLNSSRRAPQLSARKLTPGPEESPLEELKRQMRELARAGEYEKAEAVKAEFAEELRRQREAAIRSLIAESEAMEKRTKETIKAETEELEATCKQAIVEELKKFKNNVDILKGSFKKEKLKLTDKAKMLITVGPRPSRRFIELKEIEKIKARDGDFRGARVQQLEAEKVHSEDVARFQKLVKDDLSRKIKTLRTQLDENIKLLKTKLEENVNLIETHTKEKQDFVRLKSRSSLRRSMHTS